VWHDNIQVVTMPATGGPARQASARVQVKPMGVRV